MLKVVLAEMFSAAYRTSSGSAIYAGVTTYEFMLGQEALVAYDDDNGYFGTDIFVGEMDLDGTWQWALLGEVMDVIESMT